MEKITGGNDFNLVIRAKRRTGTVTEDLSLIGIDDLQIFLTRAGRSKIMMSYALDVNGCAIIYVDKDDVAKGVWGVEIKGTCEGADLRAHKINAFEIVGSMGTNGVLADYVVEVVFAVNIAASDTFVQESIAAHNEDVTAHPSLIEAIGNAGKVDDVMVDGESIVDGNKVAHIDSDRFGKVDDVRVNGESIVQEKIADIDVDVDIDGNVGEPSADVDVQGGKVDFHFHNIKGNGIASIDVDESTEDGGENTITINREGGESDEFAIRNGSRGNGIADITEERSEEDGGTNTIHIILDDGTVLIVHTMNGHTGAQGATVHYDAATDIVLDTKMGDSEVMGMTQKAVTDYVDLSVHKTRTDKTSSIVDGYYQTGNIGTSPKFITQYGSQYQSYRTSNVEKGKVYTFNLQGLNSGRVWAKLVDGKIVEKSTEAANAVLVGSVACDGTFDELIFNTQGSYNSKSIVLVESAVEDYVVNAPKLATLDKETDILSEMVQGYFYPTTIGTKPTLSENSNFSYLRTDKVWKGLVYSFNLAGGGTGRVWAKLKNGVIISTSPESPNTAYSGEVVCDGTFDELIFNSSVVSAKKLTLKRDIDTLINDIIVMSLCEKVSDHGKRLDRIEGIDVPFMPFNDIPLQRDPDEIKILAIGNSFTENTFAYMYDILDDFGVREKVSLGMNVASGRGLDAEVSQFDAGSALGVMYYQDKGGAKDNLGYMSLKNSLDYKDWDIIVLQQASTSSATQSSYEYLPELVKRIRLYSKTRPKIVFNLTWAVDNTTSEGYGGTYQMYLELVKVARMLRDTYNMDIVIPLYQAFQQVRGDAVSEGMNNLLNDDGTHANGYGQVVAALAFAETLVGIPFNKSIRQVEFRNAYLTNANADAIISCVRTACAYPFAILEEPDEEN